MNLVLITGNKRKLIEYQTYIPGLKSLAIDLPEIQSLDPTEIQTAKLNEARRHVDKNAAVIVDDTALYMGCFNDKLPGPLIKWFVDSLEIEGLYELAKKYNNFRARAACMIGLSLPGGKNRFFVGEVHGNLVEPVKIEGFQFDRFFIPDGYNVCYAEMSVQQKNQISHRGQALEKLTQFLDTV